MTHAVGSRAGTRRLRRTMGFTLVELLVVIGIIAVLAAIIMPVYGRARENARQTTCRSNLVNIGRALRMYYDDWKAYPPPPYYDDYERKWQGGLYVLVSGKYLSDWRVLRCPDDAYVATKEDPRNPDVTYSSYNEYYNYYGMWGQYMGCAFNPEDFTPALPCRPANAQQALIDELNTQYLPNLAQQLGLDYNKVKDGHPLLVMVPSGAGGGVDQAACINLAAAVYYPNIASLSAHKSLVDDQGAALWVAPAAGATGDPGSWSGDFPGLCNRNALEVTAITHCAWHRPWFGTADKTRDLVLRLGGDVRLQLVSQLDWIRQATPATE